MQKHGIDPHGTNYIYFTSNLITLIVGDALLRLLKSTFAELVVKRQKGLRKMIRSLPVEKPELCNTHTYTQLE